MRLEYISAVPSGWLDQIFLPSVKAKTLDERQPITWVVVDSSNEGNYLMEKVRSWAAVEEQIFNSITLEPSDPLLLWEDLLGTTSEEGLLLKENRLIGVWNSCFIPLRFLAGHINYLRRVCGAAEVSLLLPIFHESLNILREHIGSNEIIETPRFGSFPEARRIELLAQLITTSIPKLGESEILWVAKELAQASPSSRAEAEHWIGYYAKQPDVSQALRDQPPAPPVERFPRLPPACPTRHQLAATLEASQLKLEQASNLCQRWMGRPLIQKIEDPIVEPFNSDNSLWWFVASVSALSCQLFDGMDSSFDFFVGFTVTGNNVVSAPPDPFYKILRSLRTAMQHGLVLGVEANTDTLKLVRSWFELNSGTRFPDRSNWRRLTYILFIEWDRAATRLRDVLVHLNDDVTRSTLSAQLRYFDRRLSKNEWRTLLKATVLQINPTLNAETLLDRHLPWLQRELLKSSALLEHSANKARELVEGIVIKETSRCPVGASTLMDIGLLPGPLLGRALAHVEAVWAQTPQITKEALIEELKRWLA